MTSAAAIWLVAMGLKSTLVLVPACLLVAALRRRSAAERHLIWAVALLACLGLPIVAAVAPPLELPPSWVPASLFQPASESGAPGAPASDAAAGNLSPGIAPATSARDRPGRTAAGVPERSPLSLLAALAPERLPDSLLRVLSAAYFSFVVALLAWFAIATVIVWRRVAALAPVESGTTLELIDETRRRMNIRRTVRAFVAPREHTPWAFGLRYPAIVLPAEFAAWSEEQQRSAIIHELAHIGRCDQLTLWLGHLCCALYWFNPLVWIALRRMTREAERACDDTVLLAGVHGANYAGQLLEIANRILQSPFPSAPATAMARSTFISERIHSILNANARRTTMSRKMTAFVTLAAATLIVPIATLKSQEATDAPDDSRATESVLREEVRLHVSAGNPDEAVATFVSWLDAAGPGLSGCGYCAELLRDRGDETVAAERRALLSAFDRIENAAIDAGDAGAMVRLALIALESRDNTALDLGKHYLYEVSTFAADDPDAQWVWLQYLIEMGRLDDAAVLAERLAADESLAPDRSVQLERWIRYIASEIERNDAISGRLFAARVEPAGEEEFIPIYKAPPVYPQEAALAGLEGHAIIEFTVTELGRVKDVFVVSSSAPVFERPSIDAAKSFRYMPRTVDGAAVEVSGVRNRIAYALE